MFCNDQKPSHQNNKTQTTFSKYDRTSGITLDMWEQNHVLLVDDKHSQKMDNEDPSNTRSGRFMTHTGRHCSLRHCWLRERTMESMALPSWRKLRDTKPMLNSRLELKNLDHFQLSDFCGFRANEDQLECSGRHSLYLKWQEMKEHSSPSSGSPTTNQLVQCLCHKAMGESPVPLV